jgi:enamine deaminase RidA (YjgF/YER057c/UK114 family)
MGTVEKALAGLGIVLPGAPKPVGSYVPFVRTGNLVFISGQLPWREGKLSATGAVPTAVSVEQGKEAARVATINALAVLREACEGDLDKVVRVVKVGAFVQSGAGFEQQPQVANGASDLLAAVFGEAGKHARAAVGSIALPLNATVEIELMVEVK